jgi:starch phosphorylase
MDPKRYLPRPLPESLHGLGELALDLRWSWNHSADALWEAVDPELWHRTGNPWLILETIPGARLDALADDPSFISRLDEQLEARRSYLQRPTWFSRHQKEGRLGGVAYFSMEFGLSEALPIYSGGLGILAGDHLKAASDLGVPVVGIGLLYQQGYFHQVLGIDGEQLEFYPFNSPSMLPIVPLRSDAGGWRYVTLPMPGRQVRLRVWQVQVGRVNLYLLDSNDLINLPGDRSITGTLYGGGPEQRLEQEMVLGIGGWRLLEALGLDCTVCHLNEGHAAFAIVERARAFMRRTGLRFHEALCATRAGNIFTTHTPVAAGFDRFSPDLMARYFADYVQQLGITLDEFLALGRVAPAGPFNMAWLAIRGSAHINGVSRLHGEVSRRLFQPLFPRWPEREVPVAHVTNGVHMPSWDSAAADSLWTELLGKERWMGSPRNLEQEFTTVSDERLWTMRSENRAQLVADLRSRLAVQCATRGGTRDEVGECAFLLDPNALTLGFARRFATYKRPELLLHDRERLKRLLADRHQPVQLIIAGKAHPADEIGQAMIRDWVQFMRDPALKGNAVFVEDYDMALAAGLVQGVDLWINTPRRPWEASGTSGMKVLVNGGLNLSELDGWWAEAWDDDHVGWAIGDGAEHGEDPAWDAREADELYHLLEMEVVPLFYRRDLHGIPTGWVAHMRASMGRLTPRFSSNRMVHEYVTGCYLPASDAYRARAADHGRLGAEIARWERALAHHWSRLHFGPLEMERLGERYQASIPVYLDALPTDAVTVELYAEGPVERHPMTPAEPLTGAVGAWLYSTTLQSDRPAADYTPRILPSHPSAAVPLEATPILWAR